MSRRDEKLVKLALAVLRKSCGNHFAKPDRGEGTRLALRVLLPYVGREGLVRSNRKSSTMRSGSANRTYIITTRRITSGDELKRQKGPGGRALDLRLIAAR